MLMYEMRRWIPRPCMPQFFFVFLDLSMYVYAMYFILITRSTHFFNYLWLFFCPYAIASSHGYACAKVCNFFLKDTRCVIPNTWTRIICKYNIEYKIQTKSVLSVWLSKGWMVPRNICKTLSIHVLGHADEPTFDNYRDNQPKRILVSRSIIFWRESMWIVTSPPKLRHTTDKVYAPTGSDDHT